MPYTSNEIISGAYYASGVVSREFQNISAGQTSDGLLWLNDIIAEKVVDEGMIPYETTHDFNAVIGQEIYFIPNLIQIDTLVFFKDSVRFAMKYEKRNQYQGSPRVENIQSLMFEWFLERTFGGANLYVYFQADQNYPMQIQGIFRLPEVVLFQDLSLTLDQFFITYLRYALADRICSEYSFDTPTNVTKQLRKYESYIDKKSRVLDLRLKKISTLQKRGGYNWAFINLSGGWTVPY